MENKQKLLTLETYYLTQLPMKKLIQIFVTILAVLFTNSIYSQNFVKATRSNAGQTISLATDQVLEISLPRNPSTGYGW